MPGYYPQKEKNTKSSKQTRRKNATVSKTSPKASSRGCLCPDGKTYSRDCCDGTLEAQGVGKV
tara:strand:+ start:327 stop:515 length:189 start_codon:yes stop_codon:yes gene_type:complete